MSALLQYMPMQALGPEQQMFRYLDGIYRRNPAAFDDDALSELAGFANQLGMEFKPEYSSRRMAGIVGGNFMDALTMGLMPDKYIPKAVTEGESWAGRAAALPGLALTALAGGLGGWKLGSKVLGNAVSKSGIASAGNKKALSDMAVQVGNKLAGWGNTGNAAQKAGSKGLDFLLGTLAGANPTQIAANPALAARVPGMLGRGLLGGATAGAALGAMPYMFERNAGDVISSALIGGAGGALAGPSLLGSPGFINAAGLGFSGLAGAPIETPEMLGLSALGGLMGRGMGSGLTSAIRGGGAAAANAAMPPPPGGGRAPLGPMPPAGPFPGGNITSIQPGTPSGFPTSPLVNRYTPPMPAGAGSPMPPVASAVPQWGFPNTPRAPLAGRQMPVDGNDLVFADPTLPSFDGVTPTINRYDPSVGSKDFGFFEAVNDFAPNAPVAPPAPPPRSVSPLSSVIPTLPPEASTFPLNLTPRSSAGAPQAPVRPSASIDAAANAATSSPSTIAQASAQTPKVTVGSAMTANLQADVFDKISIPFSGNTPQSVATYQDVLDKHGPEIIAALRSRGTSFANMQPREISEMFDNWIADISLKKYGISPDPSLMTSGVLRGGAIPPVPTASPFMPGRQFN